jgi:hypothetical protein
MTGDSTGTDQPPREVLYAFYALLVVILVTTLVLVGVYV